MNVLVAVGTIGELDFILRVLPCGRMALGTLNRDVLSLERVFRRCVFLDTEERRLPGIDFVTFGTLAVLRSGIELAAMNVLVTILAIREGQRLFEIATRVAGDAGNFGVTAEQREFRLRMIKFELRRDFLPSSRRMAILAFLLE